MEETPLYSLFYQYSASACVNQYLFIYLLYRLLTMRFDRTMDKECIIEDEAGGIEVRLEKEIHTLGGVA